MKNGGCGYDAFEMALRMGHGQGKVQCGRVSLVRSVSDTQAVVKGWLPNMSRFY